MNIDFSSSVINRILVGLYISWAETKVQNIGVGEPKSDLLVNGQTMVAMQNFVDIGSSVRFTNGSTS